MTTARRTACIFLLSLLPAPIASAETLDLDRVVRLALEQNPGLQSVAEQRQQVAGGVQEARAEAFPQIRLAFSYNNSRNPSLLNSPDFEEFVETFPEGSFEPEVQQLHDIYAEVHQPIFTWGRISAAIDLAQLVVDATEATISTAELDTARAAAEAYFVLLAAEDAERVVEAQVRARDESLSVVQARYDLREATKLELLRARAAAEELQPELLAARGAIEIARSRLRTVLGLEPDATLDVSPEQRELRTAPSLDSILALAYDRRPELTSIEHQRSILEARQRLTRAGGRPQLELNAIYGRQARYLEDLADPLFDNWYASLDLSWSVFDGGRRRGQVAQLRSQEEQLRLQLDALERQIQLEVEEALTAYRTARARWRAQQLASEAAAEAARVAQATYEQGITLQADLLDAQQRAAASSLDEVEARYQAHLRSVQLCRAVGSLPTAPPWNDPGTEEAP